MQISFWLTSTTRDMNYDNWGKAPMGGAEISAVQLGEEFLKLGYDVTYYLQRAQPFDRDNLHVRRHQQVVDENHQYFICVRPHKILTTDMNKQVKKILWSGDAFDQTSNDIFFDKKTAQSMNGFVFKTDWQSKKMLEKYFYIEPEKVHIIQNGIKEEFFQPNGVMPQRNRFIHASTWYRGVHNFVEIWPKILDKIPDAEIHVFSKTSLYSELNPKDLTTWPLIVEKLSQFPGMVLREPVPQKILAQEMKKAWLMLYPNSGFVESSCGAALQSMAAGTPVITTARAGLKETVKDGGILIEEKEGWQDEFVKETINLWSDKEKRNQLADSGHRKALNHSWRIKATEWTNFLKSL